MNYIKSLIIFNHIYHLKIPAVAACCAHEPFSIALILRKWGPSSENDLFGLFGTDAMFADVLDIPFIPPETSHRVIKYIVYSGWWQLELSLIQRQVVIRHRQDHRIDGRTINCPDAAAAVPFGFPVNHFALLAGGAKQERFHLGVIGFPGVAADH